MESTTGRDVNPREPRLSQDHFCYPLERGRKEELTGQVHDVFAGQAFRLEDDASEPISRRLIAQRQQHLTTALRLHLKIPEEKKREN